MQVFFNPIKLERRLPLLRNAICQPSACNFHLSGLQGETVGEIAWELCALYIFLEIYGRVFLSKCGDFSGLDSAPVTQAGEEGPI